MCWKGGIVSRKSKFIFYVKFWFRASLKECFHGHINYTSFCSSRYIYGGDMFWIPQACFRQKCAVYTDTLTWLIFFFTHWSDSGNVGINQIPGYTDRRFRKIIPGFRLKAKSTTRQDSHIKVMGGGDCWKFWIRPLKGTKISFCSRGLNSSLP